MSFLFGWTKYFRSTPPSQDVSEECYLSESDDDELNIPEDDIKQNDDNNIIPPSAPVQGDEDDTKSDDDEDELLGGEFDTLEEELAFLRQQNDLLKQKYKFHKSQHKKLQLNMQRTGVMQMKINGQLVNVRHPQCAMSLDELSQKVEARLPQFLRKDKAGSGSTICVPSEGQNEIGVIDIQSVEWGDMIKYDTVGTDSALSTFNTNDSALQYEQSTAVGGRFIVLREVDIVDAIACFVAQCVMNIPECHNLDHEEMLLLINGTFNELKSKGPLGKMYDWGTFIYSSYGWSATAYTVYSNAAMAKTVLSCMVSAAFFIGVL